MEDRNQDTSLPRPPAAFWPFIALLALAAAAKPILVDTLDPDLFWHMVVGKQLLGAGIGPMVDHISFSSIRGPWTPYSWLAEITAYGIWEVGGYRLALLIHALMAIALMTTIAATAVQCIPRSVSRSYAAAGATAAAAFMLTIPWYAFRPAAFAILLLALIGFLIQRDRRFGERSGAIWGIVPLTALLGNVHLFAILSPLWVAALFAAALIERYPVAPERDPEMIRRIRRYGLLLLATIVACATTPMIRGVIRTALHYQFADPMVVSPILIEMQPFYRGDFGKVLALLLIVTLLVIVKNRRSVRAGEWLMLGIGAWLLFQHGRYVPLFALSLVPVLTITCSDISDRVLASRKTRWVLQGCAVAGFFLAACVFPHPDVALSKWVNRRGPNRPGYPCAAADYVASHISPTTGRIVNEFTWGGYLSWRLGDRFRVFVDGRTQVYPRAFWMSTYLGQEEQWERLLSASNADAAILPARASLFRNALIRDGWMQTYSDDVAVVLEPPPRSSERLGRID